MRAVPAFDRQFYRSDSVFARIGGGELGGKAEGLVGIRAALDDAIAGRLEGIDVVIPRVVVVATDVFDAFMDRNGLESVVDDEPPDDRLAHSFLKADLPSEVVGDLRSLSQEATRPLAVRSSSLLEDALERPFAGIYETKMIPNNQPDAGGRFSRLVEAIKLVYASTFFRAARTYRKAAGIGAGEEKMAVMIQEIVGERHGDRFYPDLSAVCRSYNYYPIGKSRPEDGVVSLALGLGKTIVDGGLCWTYSPRRPRTPRPFASVRQLMAETQTRFWAVNMGPAPPYDPTATHEYLVESDLAAAEYDGTLRTLASTYDGASDRLRPGTGSDGPRVLDFAPVLQLRQWPLNDLVRSLLEVGEATLGGPVEIELAMTLPPVRGGGPGPAAGPDGAGGRPRAGFVQVRPMRAPGDVVELDRESLTGPDVVLASAAAMGNGVESGIRDVVYVKPASFDLSHSREVAADIEGVNSRLVNAGRPYLLMGFGRWGSSDPWLGIPVTWGQVAGARVVVESTLASVDVEPSQGSHFFHNLSSTGVLYFTVRHDAESGIDWDWLEGLTAVEETAWLRHVRIPHALDVRVDGRTRLGVVRRSLGE